MTGAVAGQGETWVGTSLNDGIVHFSCLVVSLEVLPRPTSTWLKWKISKFTSSSGDYFDKEH